MIILTNPRNRCTGKTFATLSAWKLGVESFKGVESDELRSKMQVLIILRNSQSWLRSLYYNVV